jgi:hypothetical protein
VSDCGQTQPQFDAYMIDGEPVFRHSCVLAWDVLGVRNYSRGRDALVRLRSFSAALKRARERAMFEDPRFEDHAVTWLTDNVVIGTPVTSEDTHKIEMALGFTAIGVAYMQLLMLDAGYLARGAIAFGPHHMQPQMAFGPALSDAAELEKATKQPRVALTPFAADLNRAVVENFYSDPYESPHAQSYLVDDADGTVFVDHLGLWLSEEDDERQAEHNLKRLRQVVQTALTTVRSEVLNLSGDEKEADKALSKWKWLADMHNHVLDQWPQYRQFRIDAAEPLHSFRSFVSTF